MYSKIIEKTIELSKKSAEFSENYHFNYHDTLKRINLYLNSRFLDRNDGIFWNIGNYRAHHFAKNIELDTKDLMPYGEGKTNMVQTWSLRKALRREFDKKVYALFLNDLAENTAQYGSSVVKVVNGEMNLVDLRNLYFDPLVKTIRNTDVVEKHFLNKTELMMKKDVWDNVDTLLKEEVEDDRYEINEFWGYYSEDNKKGSWKRVVSWGEGENEIVLWDEDIKKEDSPYYDFHATKYQGRWLRIGVIERLFDLQERVNALVNQNAQTTEIASLLLFRTANGEILGNVLDGTLNGQIIPDETLEQIGISNTGLTQFIQELQWIEAQADKVCLTPDIIRGEALPSGTPFRSLATYTNAARSAFKMVRENVGEVFVNILRELILPDVVKEFNKGLTLDLIEDEGDLDVFDEAIRNRAKLDALLKGNVITPELEEEIYRAVGKEINKVGRKLEIPKGWFNFEWGIKFNITGEAYDKAQQNSAYEAAIQYFLANPAVNDIPLFRQYLENNGISWWKLTPEQRQMVQDMAQSRVPDASVEKQGDKLMSMVDTQ